MSDYALHHGDCLDVMPTLEAGSVDLILTDPPYRTISGGTGSKYRAGWLTSILAKNDGRIFMHNDIKIREYLPELFRVLRAGGDCYLMINNLNMREMLNAAHEVGLGFHGLLGWQKNNCTANRWYMKEVEWVAYFYKAPAMAINAMGSKQLFTCDNPRNKLHPTQKPVALFEHYIANSSQPGGVVLDPFMGSCTTGVACLNTDRRFIGIEQDAEYYAIAQQRMAKAAAVHQPALLEAN
jgi:site-specific DNA-methyltransferase (adenine-specific)